MCVCALETNSNQTMLSIMTEFNNGSAALTCISSSNNIILIDWLDAWTNVFPLRATMLKTSVKVYLIRVYICSQESGQGCHCFTSTAGSDQLCDHVGAWREGSSQDWGLYVLYRISECLGGLLHIFTLLLPEWRGN